MPRRLLVLPACLVLGLLFCRVARPASTPARCRCAGRRQDDRHRSEFRAKPAQTGSSRAAEQPPPVEPVRRATLEITPGSSTITADDPGLQLLAARNEAGSIRDLTAEVKWTRRAAGSGRDRAGRVSPARRRRAT